MLGTKRTKEKTIIAFNKKLEKKRNTLKKKNETVEGDNYVFFYYAVGEPVTATDRDVLRTNRAIWQETFIEYMEEDGNIEKFLDNIVYYVNKLPLRSAFKLNDPNRDHKLNSDYRKRYFLPIKGSKKIKPEHAIEYHLLHKRHNKLGYFVAYEFPLDLKNYFGGIDLIAYDEENKVLRLIELKKAEFEKSKASSEMFLRAYTEILTYRACFDALMKDTEKRKLMQIEFDTLGKKLDFKINLDEVTVINCILGPHSLYEDVDSKLCKFVKSTTVPNYQVELYSLVVHRDEILENPIGHPVMMVDIDSDDFS